MPIIHTDHQVNKIYPVEGDKIRIHVGSEKHLDFDRVVVTVPNPEVIRLWQDIPRTFRERLEKVRYLNLVCASIVVKNPLSPFYVTNLTDSGFPFTGFIEATHIVPRDVLGNKGLIYLPRYYGSGDPDIEMSDEAVLKTFFGGIKRIFPSFSEKDVIGARVHRENYVQPILEVNYSEYMPTMKTPLDNFYIANTTMIANSTLNNNQVVQLSRNLAHSITGV